MADDVGAGDRITFPCSGCGVKLKARPQHVGKQFQCPKCKAVVTVPETGRVSTDAGRELSPAPSLPSPACGRGVGGEGGKPLSQPVSAADGVPEIWKPGDVILDLYEVKEVLGEGGFGTVYLVHHRGWNTDLAVKSIKAKHLGSDKQREKIIAGFVAECETWMGLGLHPHTVSRYYVRILGGIPRVFAEYIPGGSLRDWITQGKLLPSPASGRGAATKSPGEGGASVDLAKVLDIAIQIAWGMAHAYAKGLVHRDLKPHNVLMTPDGTAKVADFGLARFGSSADESIDGQSAGGAQLSTGRGTPGYAAPEQVSGGPTFDHRADIFSFGVTLWSMLGGRLSWIDGVKPQEALTRSGVAWNAVKRLLKQAEPGDVPEDLAELILRCLAPEPEDRWPNFAAVIDKLRPLYEELVGEPYTRQEPQEAELLAGGLNNRALSLMDLGKTVKAEADWQQALASDAHHLESVYNWGLLRWRTARTDDAALARSLREAGTAAEPWRAVALAAQVELESDDCQAAIELLNPLEGENVRRAEVQRSLTWARELLPGSRRLLRTFKGHSEAVTSVVLSADGRYALSGSEDKTLKLWEVFSGHCLRTFEEHKNAVRSVFLSADGRYALSGSEDKTLKLWEVASGQRLQTFVGHADSVNSVFLSADGRYALSGSSKLYDRALKLWEVPSGHCLRTFVDKGYDITSVSLSANGRYALSGSQDQTLKLWEVSSGQCLRTFEGHAHWVNSVFLSTDGRYALSGSLDHTLKLWEVSSGHCLRTFEGHTEEVTSVFLSADGRYALSGSDDKTLRLWEVSSGHCLRTFEGHTSQVNSVFLSTDGRYALSGSGDHTLKLWDIRGNPSGRAPWELSSPQGSETAAAAAIAFRQCLREAEVLQQCGHFAHAASTIRGAETCPAAAGDPKQSKHGNACIGVCTDTAWPAGGVSGPSKDTQMMSHPFS